MADRVPSNTPDVSVVVPVWNDPGRLEKCLAALVSQDYPRDRYEVIVVDNGSSESPLATVERFPGTRLMSEPRPASDRARNTGVRASRGDIIAFTDADCVPQSDWLRRGVDQRSRLAPQGLLAGRIDVVPRDPSAPNLAELYDMVLGFPQERCVRRSHYGATANLFAGRDVFERVGYFRDDLTYGGDAEWGQRVFRTGRSVVYADGVGVAHPARDSIGALIARARRGAAGLIQWHRAHPPTLVRDQLKTLLLPPDRVWRVLTSSVPCTQPEKAGVLLLFVLLRQVLFWERLRILFGGSPIR